MKDPSKTKQELIEELSVLKQKIQELEYLESDRKSSEEALWESEERYRALFEHTPGTPGNRYSKTSEVQVAA